MNFVWIFSKLLIMNYFQRILGFHYISEEEFNSLKQKALDISIEIGNFIKYLKKSEITGSKYK